MRCRCRISRSWAQPILTASNEKRQGIVAVQPKAWASEAQTLIAPDSIMLGGSVCFAAGLAVGFAVGFAIGLDAALFGGTASVDSWPAGSFL